MTDLSGPNPSPRPWISWVGLPFLAAGAWVLLHAAWIIGQGIQVQRWVETPAEINRLTVSSEKTKSTHHRPGHRRTRSRTVYWVETSYTYRWEGKPHTGERFSAQTGRDGAEHYHNAHVRLVRNGGSGGKTVCFVNPSQPTQSVLSREVRWMRIGMLTLLGLASLSIGVGIFSWTPGETTVDSRRRRLHPDEPWLWRADWAAGYVGGGSGFPVNLVWVSAVWIVMAFTPLALSWVYPSKVPDANAWMVYLPPIPAVLMVAWAVYEIRSHRRYGTTRLHLDQAPVHPGETLQGEIHIPADLSGAQEIRYELTCTHRYETNPGKKNAGSRSDAVCNRKWTEAPPPPGPDGHTRLVLSIPLPAEAPGTILEGDAETVSWELQVEAELPGLDVWENFDLPVFDAPPADAPQGESDA